MSSPTPLPNTETTTLCPSCRVQVSGKFCSNCGATLAAATCAACDAPLSPGAKFCHRCGTAAGAAGDGSNDRSFSAAIPWGVAAIALVALIALVAGQRFSKQPAAAPADSGVVAPFAGANAAGQPPDLSTMTPGEAAIRLYNRVMAAHEAGHADTVALFAPMAIQAYQMLGNLDLDQRYDLGRVAAISGDEPLARAEADSILAQNPTHLLGLILAANAAHIRKDAAAEKTYHDKLVAAAPAEKAKQLPEYIAHTNDIALALDAKRP